MGTVFTAAGAGEALALLEQNPIDIMLTDICMPETTGIQLVETLETRHPTLRTIVLTGYSDFEYAQQCCRLPVHEFLLKPIDENQLKEAVHTQLKQLERQRQSQREQEAKSRAFGAGEAVKLEQALRALCMGAPSPEGLLLLAAYGAGPGQAVQIALVVPRLIDGEGWQNENELHWLAVKYYCIEQVDRKNAGITFEDRGGRLGVVFLAPAENGSETPTGAGQPELLRAQLQKEFSQPPRIFYGSRVSGIHQLHISYNDALRQLQSPAGSGSQSLPRPIEAEQKMQDFLAEYSALKLQICANPGSEETAGQVMPAFAGLVKQYNPSVRLMRRCCFELAGSAYFTLSQQSCEEPDDRMRLFHEVLAGTSPENILPLTGDFLRQLQGQMELIPENTIIHNAKSYIKQHLAEELSVASIAKKFYLNVNYFSRLFKHLTGEGCNEYITRKRMERAKALLEGSSLKTGQIAEEVGYKDKNYFSLSFKKYYGCSPTAFREKLWK